MNKVRVSVLLEPSTIELLEKEAKDKSISLSAVIRQKVIGSYLNFQMVGGEEFDMEKLLIKFNRNGKTDV